MSGPLDDAGGVIVCGFHGEAAPDTVLRWVGDGSVAGVILFKRNIASAASVAALNRTVNAQRTQLPPLICVDQEGGRVARLGPPVLTLPPAQTWAAAGDVTLVADAATVLGEQLCALGFNLNFAPVLDINTNPHNPVIGDRAFGHLPEHVSRHGIAFANGLHAGGVLSCGKHFPGHGDTELDSHLALPHIRHELSRLRTVELAPFVAAKEVVPALMSAHMVVHAIDPTVPATLSHKVMTGLLREELGFVGAVFSDDLEMNAISDQWSIGEASVLSIAAGCDTLLVCSKYEECEPARDMLVREAERSPTFAARLREARQRTDALRKKAATLPAPQTLAHIEQSERFQRVQSNLARLSKETVA